MHIIAISHIILILAMVGVYEYFSEENNRFNNILNAITPMVFLTALHGFYLEKIKK
jgi:uncharacterized membrane protein